MRISDWSSDVCSSDLRGGFGGNDRAPQRQLTGEKASGTVKFFTAMKGFGFIQRDDGQPDAFVHISAVERAGMAALNEGDRLDFELEVDRRGKYAAVNLQIGRAHVRTPVTTATFECSLLLAQKNI